MLPDRKARIEAKIAQLALDIQAINDAITNRLSAGGGFVSGYEFDSGHGRQKMTYTRLSDMMQQRDLMESQLERLKRQLNGTGLHTITMRRKG